MIIQTKAYPRAGLIGNPSDGYFGKTISFTFRNFEAHVVLYESPELEILPAERDHSCFRSIGQLAEDVRRHGYYGGLRLLKATIRRFYEYCAAQGLPLDHRNFTIRYHSTIPAQVGLAGSSAIITAGFRALMAFYQVTIPPPILAGQILAVETEELCIPAGLQDRVAQVYQGLVYMDFEKELLERQGYGRYEPLDPALLPPLYIAYRTDLAEGTEVFHNNIRARWMNGDPEVLAAMQFWADLTVQVRELLLRGEKDRVGPLMDASFDRRRQIYNVGAGNLRMVEAARAAGASAKFPGSGGAIVGTYKDEAMYAALQRSLEPLGVKVLKPELV